MDKIDYKKTNKSLYSPSSLSVKRIEVPSIKVLSVEGSGDPNTSEAFRQATEALFSLSYGIKFAIKRSGGPDYVVMPLEGLYPHEVAGLSKADWRWTLIIRQPDEATIELVERVREEVARKKKLPLLSEVNWCTIDEGLAVQIMHIGSYDTEGPTMEKITVYMNEQGFAANGLHHEIYLSDPRKADPGKMKTIIRQPVKTLM
ncbi:GyrI-like domain-containing protein [Cohnella silvisoli]|uniref:GyrI-like domain-containing protein n=1 Tax=Cohnella silvisoli TaxID=2873699 RepID=A0ABV1KMC7_9BACL|nr:GyrI-like domain-containing protein [Cohnella silvisoli]MCD9020872.1 GyrI-like domain-containing protein [Cohnella silvisoli]